MARLNNKYVSIRLNEDMKSAFENFCESCGLTVSGAVTLLVKNTIRKKGIPFRVIASPQVVGFYEGGEKQGMRYSIRIDEDSRERFSDVCDNAGVSMSRMIKMFMAHCLNTGRFPFAA